MPARTLYFRDKKVWERIQRIADQQRIPASGLVEKLMQEYISEYKEPDTCPTCGQALPTNDDE
jgi:hypothetical protein